MLDNYSNFPNILAFFVNLEEAHSLGSCQFFSESIIQLPIIDDVNTLEALLASLYS